MSNIAPHPSSTGTAAPCAQACAASDGDAMADFNVSLNLDLDLITTRAAFDALEGEWNALFARAGLPTQIFQTFNWNWHWANHYLSCAPGGLAGVELSIVTGRRNGKLVMIWPLVSERVRGIRQIFWMGEPISQYGDVLIDDLPDGEAVLRAGWAHLTAHTNGDIVRLRRVRADSRIAALLPTFGAMSSNTQTAPYLALGSATSFDKYEQRYNSRARRNRRRLMRRLDEQSHPAFARHRGGDAARDLATHALDLKAEWLADRGLVSQAISDDRTRGFFADVARAASHSVDCIVSTLSCDDEVAALDVSFTCKGRVCVHVIVFNLKYEKAGVGALLMEQSLKDAYAEGMTTLDLMAPGDNYKLDWADASVEISDWSRPLSIAGHAYARIYLNLLRDRMKSAMAAMPQSLRKMVSGANMARTGRGHAA